MTRPTPQAVTAALTDPVAEMLARRVIAETLREEIDGYKQTLLDATEHTNAHSGERITEPRYDWTMGDEAYTVYSILLGAMVRAAGHNPPEDTCPALSAEWELTQAENALIKAAEPLFGCTNDQLLCGTKDKGGLETQRDYLDLLTKLTLNAPALDAA